MNRNFITAVRLREMPEPDSYLSALPVIRALAQMGQLDFPKSVTFFVGENGAGKSTLLEAIAVAAGFNAEGGSRDFFFSTCVSHSELYRHITTVRTVVPADGFFLRAESFYNTASYLERNSKLDRYGGRSFHAQSHGEAFLALAAHRFEGHGLYLLDEPETALSPRGVLALLYRIHELSADSQFLIATHSPILMACPGAQILEFSADGIRETEYQQTEHYRLTKQFLDAPERMLSYLLEQP